MFCLKTGKQSVLDFLDNVDLLQTVMHRHLGQLLVKDHLTLRFFVFVFFWLDIVDDQGFPALLSLLLVLSLGLCWVVFVVEKR
jgi:hypothetical protein